MPYTTLVAGTTITAAWANASVRDQGVTPFATAAARTSAVVTPIEGMLSYRTDTHGFEGYDGATWVAVPYSILKYKTADQTVNNSTTLANDTHLAWPVAASGVYSMELHFAYNSGTSADIKFGWTFPVGLTMNWMTQAFDTSSTWVVNAGFIQTTVVSVGGTAGEAHVAFHGIVTNSTTAGTLQLQWAQAAAFVADTIMRTGAFGRLTRLS